MAGGKQSREARRAGQWLQLTVALAAIDDNEESFGSSRYREVSSVTG